MNWVQSKSESTVELVSFGSAQIGILKVRYIRKKSTFELSVNYPQSTKESKELLTTRLNVSVRFRSNWNLEALIFEGSATESEHLEKNLSEQGENRQPKLNPHTCMASTLRFEPRRHWWQASAHTHHGATPSSLYVKLWTWRQLKNKMQN